MEHYKELMSNVPFGNSIFQNKVLRKQDTPEREYRNCLLQLRQKQNALTECRFRRQRIEIDIEEIESKLSTCSNEFERRRLLIDKEEKQYQLDNEIKLIEDALIEVKTFESILKSLPKFTREEFERAEFKYWKNRFLQKMNNEVIINGAPSVETVEALRSVGIVISRNEKNQLTITEYPLQIEEVSHEILRLGTSDQIKQEALNP